MKRVKLDAAEHGSCEELLVMLGLAAALYHEWPKMAAWQHVYMLAAVPLVALLFLVATIQAGTEE